ncbi:MAG TPA: ATP-binding protein [Candidatus Limnocylindrales bacterium]|nr:ATP-binding protein [Candidatus Limnocylindrales bacterium]
MEPEPIPSPSPALRASRGWRWIGAALGLGLGLFDAMLLSSAMGVDFRLNGESGTLFVGAYFGVSLAIVGFLLGETMEARRRDREAAALIEQQNQTILATRARLLQSEKLAALGQLAAAIAHEVRNPLGIIRSAAQGIAESLEHPDEDTRKACSFITAETDRLNNVVSSLLQFARPIKPAPRPVRVEELFDTALLLVRDEIARKQVQLRCVVAASLPSLDVDRDLITQVLVDLLSNAAEAAPTGGEVTLAASSANGSIVLEVADSGAGIPADLRARVFEPFFTTKASGTGLGLAIAKQIVGAHGGRIEAGERKGGGARLIITLPLAPAAAMAA